MKLSEYALSKIAKIIIGDSSSAPRLTGKDIVDLFNSVRIKDIYDRGLPEGLSRSNYTVSCLKKINDKKELKELIEIVFMARHFLVNKPDDPLIRLQEGMSQNLPNIEKAVEEFNNITKDEGVVLIKNGHNYIVSSSEVYDDPKDSKAHFDEIKERISVELKKAKYLIWVAVAWFTDKDLFNILLQKVKEGLSVQVVIMDDNINQSIDLSGVYVVRKPARGNYGNLMHNKFCIIDLKVVIHGSYNWTTKAQYNDETIDIKTGREEAEKFADQFKILKAK